MSKYGPKFVRASTSCQASAIIHYGAVGKKHRGCPRNDGPKKSCFWRAGS